MGKLERPRRLYHGVLRQHCLGALPVPEVRRDLLELLSRQTREYLLRRMPFVYDCLVLVEAFPPLPLLRRLRHSRPVFALPDRLPQRSELLLVYQP